MIDFIVLDLDDTIYPEFDYVKSGFFEIVKHYVHSQEEQSAHFLEMVEVYQSGSNAILYLFEKLGMDQSNLNKALEIYRNHPPSIELPATSKSFFNQIRTKGIRTGLITDGRSVTQRNKLKALGIEDQFDLMVISEEFGSEKPSRANYSIFEKEYPTSNFCYVGDNTKKDFISPSQMGWSTFCVRDSGKNIHNQRLEFLPEETILVDNLVNVMNYVCREEK